MNCPSCNSSNIEALGKYSSELSAYGTAVECLNCGLSSPIVASQNQQAHEEASRLFSSIRIDKPLLQVTYSSSKPGFSVSARFYVFVCIGVVGLTLFLVLMAAGK